MADDALNDSSELPRTQDLVSEAKGFWDASRREGLRRTVAPYGVDLETKTFYFGPEAPAESSWEISGEWAERGGATLIKSISVFPSRRVFSGDGDPELRASGSLPEGGLNRDIMRRLGSDAPIRRAIQRHKDAEADELLALVDDESELPDSGAELVEQRRAATVARSRKGKPFDWWVARADEYLTVTEKLGTTYGVQAQLADKSVKVDYWGVEEAGTRWRVKRLREMGLIDDSGPISQPGKNHPRMKEQNDG